jgi:hypothetical protein
LHKFGGCLEIKFGTHLFWIDYHLHKGIVEQKYIFAFKKDSNAIIIKSKTFEIESNSIFAV